MSGTRALPAGWAQAKLGDLTVDGPTNGYSGATGADAAGSPTLRLSATTSGAFVADDTTVKKLYETIPADSCLWLKPGDLLVQRSNTRDLVGTAAVYEGPADAYVYPDLMMRIRLKRPESTRWVWRYMNSPAGRAFFRRIAAGSSGSMPKINGAKLKQMPIPLPPIDEQRRIAEVLDRAERLRVKRRAALAQLDGLTQAIFLDLFGDPATNPKGWPSLRLKDSLSMPLRNGLSPSSSGKVSARVLTLSAITGSRFDATAWKTSTFQAEPPSDQAVDESDFLICRGNGNVRLVGKGYFPTCHMPDVTFPDTMIAARVSSARIERAFLQHVWNSNAVRGQVESLARTTNGTFKINQTMLERIAFIAPPLSLQGAFARRAAAVERLKGANRSALVRLDALFAALQHRAFRGEL